MFLAFCVLSCRRHGIPVDRVDTADTAGGSFTAVINGKPWVAMDSARSATIMNGFISLSGLSSDGQNLVFSLAGVSTGTYLLGSTSPSLISWTNSTMYLQNFSTTQGGNTQSGGQVVVTAIDQTDQTISGTFHCLVYSDSARYAITVADGVFNQLPYITSFPVSPPTDTFTVQINGVSWSAPSITGNIVEGEFLVQGSTTDGRTVLDVEVPVPAQMSPVIGNYSLQVGLNMLGIYSVQYVQNDSVFISQTILSAAGGEYSFQENQGYLQVVENDLIHRRLSAWFAADVNDSSNTRSFNFQTGIFLYGISQVVRQSAEYTSGYWHTIYYSIRKMLWYERTILYARQASYTQAAGSGNGDQHMPVLLRNFFR